MLPTLTVLSAMGLLVLMIACANIAGLVLVRGVSRRGEIAVRLALGATRTRIVRLLIVENLVLARARRRARRPARAARRSRCSSATPSGSPRPQRVFFNIGVDGLVIGFAALVACGSALVFGFVPALQSSRVDLVSVINEDASPRGAARGRLRAGLVVAQVAVSLLLLVGAGLATRSLDAARRANPGFDAEPRDGDRAGRQAERATTRRAAACSIASCWTRRAPTPASNPPRSRRTRRWGFSTRASQRVAIEGYEPRRGEDLAFMSNTVGPDYFRTLRIPLVAGREFEDRDDETARAGGDRQQHARAAILGRRGERDRQADPRRRRRLADGDRRGGGREVLADQRSAAAVLLPAVPAVVPIEHDPAHPRRRRRSTCSSTRRARVLPRSTPICRFCTRGRWPNAMRGALMFFDLTATMLFVFGVAGMALAAMGTYGLVSYTVKQSTHEIGIRMALGASGPSVVRRFLGARPAARRDRRGARHRRGARRQPAARQRAVRRQRDRRRSRSRVRWRIVLGGVVVATIVPAWRAARTNPLSALRHQ